ncbi:MAG: hypothetical protein ACXAEN_24930, partial [Candidatus Thorarchaeota archaeon]
VTVRNPIDVLVTKWIVSPSTQSFRDWVFENKNSEAIIEPLRGLWRRANNFVWYEDIHDDLKHVFHYHSGMQLPFNQYHVTKAKKPWWTYVDGDYKLLNLLLGYYAGFMKRFGYEFGYVGGKPHMFLRLDVRRELCKPTKYGKA